jgi:DNA-binding CsgD family transcriptional regulator
VFLAGGPSRTMAAVVWISAPRRPGGRTAVIIHPAAPNDTAPVVALSYGLTDRESNVAMHCIQGHPTREIAKALSLSPYTVQDHLKSIFAKTGVRTRGELVGADLPRPLHHPLGATTRAAPRPARERDQRWTRPREEPDPSR